MLFLVVMVLQIRSNTRNDKIMKNVKDYLKKMWKIFLRAREAAAMSDVDRYLASSSSLQDLERRQKELMLKGL